MKSRRILTPVLVLLAASAVSAVAGACGAPADDEATSPPAASSPASAPSPSSSTPSPDVSDSPSPTPEVSWDWIRTREYREWEHPPGWQRRRTTTSPHSEAKVIFIDPATAAAIGSGESRFPAGATIVKEGYDSSGDLAIIAAMQRLPGRGWLFAEYRSGGEVVEEAKNPPLCTQCHTGDQDGVLAFSLD